MRLPLTYANVASTLALVVAVGGGGAAIASGLAKDSVSSLAIRDNSVTSADIRNSTIRARDLEPGAVSGYRIKDGTIRAKDIREGSLLGKLLAEGTLTGAHLAPGSLTGALLADGTLTGAHLANDSLTGDDIDESTLDLDIPSAAPGAIVVASAPSGQTTLVAGANQGAEVNLVAPTAGVAMVTIQAEFNASEGSRFVTVQPTRNGSSVGYYDWDTGDVDGLFDQRQSAFAVVPVAAGSHQFAFSMTEERLSGSYSSYYGAQIAVQFFPSAPAAGAPAPKRMIAPNG